MNHSPLLGGFRDQTARSAQEAQQARKLERAVVEFAALFDQPVVHGDVAYHSVAACMHKLCAAIREAELAGVSTEEIARKVALARDRHGRSPFVRRIQTWPRGYPGDFETIEHLCSGGPERFVSTTECLVEQYCLREGNAQQHRNKIEWQARMILQVATSMPDSIILSIACGGSRDLRSIQDFLGGSLTKFVLNDMDADALAFSVASLPALEGRITTLHGDAFSSTRKFKKQAPYDLILAGGLFDYLDDKQIVWLLPKLHAMLKSGGRLCFTNLAEGNPSRVWMSYMADWHLNERNEDDIGRLLGDSCIPSSTCVAVERDATGLTLLVKMTKEDFNKGQRTHHHPAAVIANM